MTFQEIISRITSAVMTLTNKTISGSSNTLSNIGQSSVTNLTSDLSTITGNISTNTARLIPTKYGSRFSDNFVRGSLGSNYTKTGSTGTFTITSNTLVVSAGINTLTEYEVYNAYTSNENATATSITYTVGTMNSTSYGLAIGKQSVNTFFGRSLQFGLDLTNGANSGKINVYYNNSITPISTSVSKLTITAGDVITLGFSVYKNIITVQAVNTTTKRSITHTYPISYAQNSPGIGLNAGQFAIYAIGGTQTVTLFSHESLSQSAPQLTFIGDSIGDGTYSYTSAGKWFEKLAEGSQKSYNQYSGGSDRTTEVIACLPSILANCGADVFIIIGTNDLGNSRSAAAIRTDYATIVTALQGAGKTVHILLCLPRTGIDVTTVNANLVTDYPTLVIDTYTPFWSGTSTTPNLTLVPDGTHPAEVAGQQLLVETIEAALPTLFQRKSTRLSSEPQVAVQTGYATALNFDVLNAANTPLARFANTVNPVSYLSFSNEPTATQLPITVNTTDTDLGIDLIPKGAGSVRTVSNVNNNAIFQTQNTNAGTAAIASIRVANNASATMQMGIFSSAYTTSGVSVAGTSALKASTDLYLGSTAAALYFHTGGSATGNIRGNINSTGKWRIGDNTSATDQLEVAGNITLTGNVTTTQSINSTPLTFSSSNTNAGTSAGNRLSISSNSGIINLIAYSSTYNAGDIYTGNDNALTATGSRLLLLNQNASGTIVFGTGGNSSSSFIRGNITSGGLWKIGDNTAATSTLSVGGSFATFSRSITALRTLDATDMTIFANGTFTVTLPTAVGITDREYLIKNTGSGTITIATTSSQTIDGATTQTLATQYKYMRVKSDGATWFIIANN